ncbi:Bud-site selection protein [Lentinula guzmanii]|uniref:Bud-site selection protein n=1 Tax=Lentinula guzmanii TaxID=2804957 RepID=A0AA38JI47_9AGAR|nr:Bud-site selection protein [Lentinula guzmanii]
MKENAQKRGLKRKRIEHLQEKDIGARVAGKLHHDLKEVRKAAKKAKTFETQKLVKKLKGLRSKDESDADIMDCELQLKHLKLINHEAVANTALKTRLTKDKILSVNKSVQTALSKELTSNLLQPADGGTAAAKIQSRLLSSRVLSTEVSAAVEDLRSVIVPPTGSQDGDVSAELDESASERPKKMKKVEEDSDVEMDLGEGVPDHVDEADEDEADADEWESGTIGDDEKEPDDGWESGSVVGESEGYMDEDSYSDNQEEPKRSFQKPDPIAGPSNTNSKPPTGNSTFLPTLSTGFIRGSDSDWSDNEDNAADIGQKKNRRGQRARRAIWEKKFGKNANHKKKEAALHVTGESERGMKRWSSSNTPTNRPSNKPGASRKTQQSEGFARPMQHDSGWGQRETSAADRVREARPLHPSWEAKKKLKERQSAAIVAPPGRKIKFS